MGESSQIVFLEKDKFKDEMILCNEFEEVNRYPMGIESAVNMAEYVFENYPRCRVYFDLENLPEEIVTTFNEKLLSCEAEMYRQLVKDGDADQYVGEDGNFYWKLTEQGKLKYDN